ncbi:MAG: crosslink repair DNA glycosylase YcaQ family protein [Ignavibacteria bacterium]
MEKIENISLSDARHIILYCQKLSGENYSENKDDLCNIIDQLGYVQIDTISVVERSHHHILWSRMPLYKKIMLDELLESDKKIFEYWSHAAAFLPMNEFRFSLIRKKHFLKKHKTWGSADTKIIKKVYQRIKVEGPLRARDFDDPRTGNSGWWDWKPSKDALDYLFHAGKVMVARRQGFQKVYDLTDRILPRDVITDVPKEKEFYQHLILTAIKSNGLVTQKEIMYLRKYDRKVFERAFKALIKNDKIRQVSIETLEEKYFTISEKLRILDIKKELKNLHILSPFDNLVIQRKRLKTFFNFDFQIECYLPQSKRKFGYFSLPVLYGDKFIGKIDLKASRISGSLIINNFFPESGVKINGVLKDNFKKKLNELAEFSCCNKISGSDIF